MGGKSATLLLVDELVVLVEGETGRGRSKDTERHAHWVEVQDMLGTLLTLRPIGGTRTPFDRGMFECLESLTGIVRGTRPLIRVCLWWWRPHLLLIGADRETISRPGGRCIRE